MFGPFFHPKPVGRSRPIAELSVRQAVTQSVNTTVFVRQTPTKNAVVATSSLPVGNESSNLDPDKLNSPDAEHRRAGRIERAV
jgi:hypothetical protein